LLGSRTIQFSKISSLELSLGGLQNSEPRRKSSGGADRDRTDDLRLAKPALSQLSYSPMDHVVESTHGGPGKIRTSDLALIRRALSTD
jgi:hypothetical protein